MLKKNLLLVAKLLITIFLSELLLCTLALTVFNVGERMLLIQIFNYFIELLFAMRCFVVMRKTEHIKQCIGVLILGAVIFVYGIYNLITYESWLDSSFISSMIFSIAIFSGALFVLKKRK